MEFYKQLEQFKEQIAVISEDGREISYNTLIKDSDQFGSYIFERTLIFIMCKNTYEALVGYIGSLRKHIVPVLINEGIDRELLAKLQENYRPSYIFMPNQNCEKKDNIVYSIGQYSLVKMNYDIDYVLYKDLALLLTTSGSTGSPKLVRQSYENITSNAEAICTYLEITDKDRPITTLPMAYTYGLSIINSHLARGASLILTEKTLMEKAFWMLFKEYKATTFGGVPYIYEMLKKIKFSRMNLPFLRVITQAGGRLSPQLSKEFAQVCEEKGMKFIVMYGQTEATARISYLPNEYAKDKAGSIGIAIPGGKLELIDADGNIIEEPEVTGELIYKGPNVTLGYAENRFELANGDENKGVLHTGDMAKRDKEGFYYIVGRKKRFLKLFGNRVNLDEVEQLLMVQGFECVCSGKDDALEIYTVDHDEEAIKQYIVNHTGINPSGFHIQYIEKIPRNEAGKVLYSELG